MDNCVFCKIINNEFPSYKVYEDDDVLAIIPKDVEVYGHTLVIPKQHYENIFDIDDATLQKLIAVVKKLSLQYQKTLWATGVNILHASGKDAQQTVFHFHFHIFPRFENDGLDTRPHLTPVQDDKDLMLKRLRWEDIN